MNLSIYMPQNLPGRDAFEDPIRIRNLVRKAEGRLIAEGMRAAEAPRNSSGKSCFRSI
jgi:hypothetical protein